MGNLCGSEGGGGKGGGAGSGGGGGGPATQTSDRYGFRSGLVQRRDGDDIWKKYEQGDQIGKGMTGGVWIIKHRVTGQRFAMKSIILNRVKQELLDDLRNEIDLLKMVRGPRGSHPCFLHKPLPYQVKLGTIGVCEVSWCFCVRNGVFIVHVRGLTAVFPLRCAVGSSKHHQVVRVL